VSTQHNRYYAAYCYKRSIVAAFSRARYKPLRGESLRLPLELHNFPKDALSRLAMRKLKGSYARADHHRTSEISTPTSTL
jgi:hypothetical protein